MAENSLEPKNYKKLIIILAILAISIISIVFIIIWLNSTDFLLDGGGT